MADSTNDPLDAATSAYKRRSRVFYDVLTDGLADQLLTPEDRVEMERAHRILGRAVEAEVFNERERPDQGEGREPDQLPPPLPRS